MRNFDDWITPADAARLRGVSRQAIASLIRRDRLRVLQLAGRTFLSRTEVKHFVPRAPGRKRLVRSY